MEILGMLSLLFLPASAIAVYLLSLARKRWKAVELERSSLRAKHLKFLEEQKKIKTQHAQFEEILERRSDAIRLQAGQLEQRNLKLNKIWHKLKGYQQQLDEKRLELEKRSQQLEKEFQQARDERERLAREPWELAGRQTRLKEKERIIPESSQLAAEESKLGDAVRNAEEKSHLPKMMHHETDRALLVVETEGSQELKRAEDQVASKTSEAIPPGFPELREEPEKKPPVVVIHLPSSKIPTENRGIDPIKRGGGRTSSVEVVSMTASGATKQFKPKPEIVCWKRERSWTLSVEIPDQMLETGEIRILQGGAELSKNDYREGWWDLNSLFSEVNVQGLHKSESVALMGKRYLLFKLSSQNENLGRFTNSVSSGFYLVVVPKDWERDIALSGPAPVSPELVSLFEDHSAHFFAVGEDGSHAIAFKSPGDRRPVIELARTPKFELAGNRFPDNVGAVCPLFMDHLPKIRAAYQQAWNEVREIIVGIEGPGRQKWRKQTLPVDNLIEQELPQDILEHQCGWYFARIYDAMGDLIDSFEFKFFRGLKGIKLPVECLCPGSAGHESATVELIHEPSLSIQPADENSSNVAVECTPTRTVLSIPPDPRCDETRWTIGSNDVPTLDVSILVERLWWTVADLESEPIEWNVKIAVVETANFAPTSSRALWIRFPKISWCERVRVGFSLERAKTYPTRSRSLCIPLREFCDCEALSDAPGLKPFFLWINLGNRVLELTPCNLLVQIHCRLCGFVANNDNEIVAHIDSLHAEEFFSQLNYEELRFVNRDLPQAIYKCSYCQKFYAEAGDLSNPTSKICHHIDYECENVDRGRGIVQPSFGIVTDIEEITENILQNLPRLFRCKNCFKRFDKEPSRSEMVKHLFLSHRNELYELC